MNRVLLVSPMGPYPTAWEEDLSNNTVLWQQFASCYNKETGCF